MNRILLQADGLLRGVSPVGERAWSLPQLATAAVVCGAGYGAVMGCY